jgi:RHS repeat-associated protein
VGVAAAVVVVGQMSAALATPATAPSVEVAVNETVQPVLHGTSTDAGTGSHSMHFYARTVGSSTWNLLNNISVAGTSAFEALPAGQLSIGQAFQYQIADCDSSGCTSSAVTTGYVSPDLAAGSRPSATRLPFTVGDRISAQVDVGTGNLMVSTTQLSLQRVAGSLDLGLAYNGLTLAPGSRFSSSISPGWRFSTGRDIKLKANAGGSVTYYGANGLTGTFFLKSGSTTAYDSPKTVKGDLTKLASGGGWDLVMHGSNDKYHFTSAGRFTTITDRNTLNGNSNVTTFSYDTTGSLTQVQTDKGSPGASTVTVTSDGYTHQIQSLTQSPTGATARSASYIYDSNGNLSKITDVLGRDTTFGYGSAGDLTSITAPGGAETDFAYDSAHRVTSVTQPSAGTTSAVTRLVYNNGTTLEADPNTDQSSPVSSVPHTTYDLATTGPTAGLLLVSQATDPSGAHRSATYTTFSDVETAANSSGTTTFGHTDNSGESLNSITAATGAKSSFTYGNTAVPFQADTATDAQGNKSLYSYDGAGNAAGTADASGASATVDHNDDGTVKDSVSPSGATTTYGYGTTGYKQVLSITPPTGNSLATRTYTYDAFGRIATYASGRLDTSPSQNPIVQTFSYDAADRVTEVDYSDSTPSVKYTYNSAGQVATRIDASGTTTYTYDPLGRLASRVHTAGGGLLSYSYDLDGNLTSETDGNGTTQHAYTNRNLLTSTTTPDGKVIAFDYNGDGKRTDTWFATNTGNTTWAAHTRTIYDTSNRVTRVWTSRNSSNTTLVSDLSYSYTAPSTSACSTVGVPAGTDTGLRWSQTDNIAGVTTSYCYDQANHLTKATTPGGDAWVYTYDASGNRTKVTKNGTTVQTMTYNSANQVSTSGYSYDAAGNLTATPGSVNLSYNGSDQLTGRSGGATGSYTYAGSDQNELISQVVPGASTYTYDYGRTDQNGLPILDTFTSPNGTNYLTHDVRGTPLAFKTYNGSTSYYVLDGLGSPVALVNTSGVVIATYTYDPYGTATVGNPTGSAAAGLNPYRFAGGLNDRSTGYVKFGMRYYDPATGRFTQQDGLEVIGNPGSGNRYQYVGDDPVNYVDLTGRCSIDTWVHYSLGLVIGGATAVAGALTSEVGVGIAGMIAGWGIITDVTYGMEVCVSG